MAWGPANHGVGPAKAGHYMASRRRRADRCSVRLQADLTEIRQLIAVALMIAGVAAAWFGFENHRTARPAGWHIGWQALFIAAGPIAAAIIAP